MNNTHPNASRDASTGPGAILAQARMDLRLGLEEVAHRLHLSQRQIQALEMDDYRGLSGATYVRGYLRSYATLLGLDPATVLDAHSRITTPPSAPTDFANIAPQREITSRHHQVRLVTYLLGAIVIGLAIAWWQGRDRGADSPLVTTRSDETTVAPAGLDSPTALAGAAQQPATPPIGSDAPQPGPSIAKPDLKAPAPAEKPVAAKPASELAPPVMRVVEPVGIDPKAIRGKLTIHATQDTWLDVRDARQVKLIYETMTAGRTITLEGVVPISIFVGNAGGTQMEFNGKPVDVARHKRGMVARFSVGESELSVKPAVTPAAGAPQ